MRRFIVVARTIFTKKKIVRERWFVDGSSERVTWKRKAKKRGKR